jgi:hypothetical protein
MRLRGTPRSLFMKEVVEQRKEQNKLPPFLEWIQFKKDRTIWHSQLDAKTLYKSRPQVDRFMSSFKRTKQNRRWQGREKFIWRGDSWR